MNEENVCEHCYQQAPAGKRFCSDACRRCELADCDETQECARLCLPRWVLRPEAPLGYDEATEQERAEIIDATISQPSQGSR